jgi:hypothetical protein
MTKDNNTALDAYMRCVHENGTRHIEVAPVNTFTSTLRGTPGEYDSYGLTLINAYHAQSRRSIGDVFIPWSAVAYISMAIPPHVEQEAIPEEQP